MENPLIIVESPTKAKIIKKFLGKHYDVISSMGHVMDLPVNKFAVDIDNRFKPEYEIIKNKKSVVANIKNMAKNANKIYLAMDEDREGEAIGWHLVNAVGIDNNKHSIDRIVFHEVTEQAINDALMNPRKINMDLVDAQQARRVLDRIVGYRISPLLSRKIRKGLSAGRVQSVGLKMIVEREKERNAFKVQTYYTVEGTIEKDGADIGVKLWGKDSKKFDKLYLTSREKAQTIIDKMKGQELSICAIEDKTKKKHAMPPFITSTLQQEAFNKLGFNPEKTMRIAQQLYEGVDLPDGSSSGLITYMRTDSVSIAQSAVKSARKLISEKYTDKYLPKSQIKYRSKKTAQEAHECIRPTEVYRIPEDIEKALSPDQAKLYRVIWQRFVASQMKPALIKNVIVELECGGYQLKASGQTLLFDGYMRVWHTVLNEVKLPVLEKGMVFSWKTLDCFEHETKPPARYTPATIIKELEKNGIGRPSTYATILNTLFKRKYIIIEHGALIPQEIGMVVVDVMEKHFSRIIDNEFTAKMEENLDDIAHGKYNWQEMMDEFYEDFKKEYQDAVSNMEKIKDEQTDIKCQACGAPMVIKWGRNGKFLACSAFPKCRKAFSIDENGDIVKDKKTEMKCPKCKADMVIKTGRFGKFLACSGYPKCKQTYALDKDENVIKIPLGYEKCPECGKDTVIRSGRKGKFLACTGFPGCRFSKELKNTDE
ncbi:MAG: type I DNA topoisomerase [Elusimicrobiota bacterium]